jgi:DNA-binding NarL/FixJ family response regulator
MTRQAWQQRTSPTEVFKRAGGRRHYNQIRALHALLRRLKVAKLAALGYTQSAIAQELQVHRSTICRDLTRLAEESQLRPSQFLRY